MKLKRAFSSFRTHRSSEKIVTGTKQKIRNSSFFRRGGSSCNNPALISSSSLSSSSSSEFESSSTTTEEADDENDKKMVQLSRMMSDFVIESAKKTRDSIRDESERDEFVQSLRLALRNEVVAPPVVSMKNFKKIISEKKATTTTTTIIQNDDKDNDNGGQYGSIDHNEEKQQSFSSSSTTSTENVIEFLVQTSKGVLKSIPKEDDRYAFKEQLRTSFRKEFLSSS